MATSSNGPAHNYRNITVATFANSGLYKKEAYDANLWAGKILSDHGVPVAYKSVSIPRYPTLHRS